MLVAGVATLAAAGLALFAYKKFYLRGKSAAANRAPVTLQDPTVKYQLPLIEKEEINHNTRRFRFGLPTGKHVLGLPIGELRAWFCWVEDGIFGLILPLDLGELRS